MRSAPFQNLWIILPYAISDSNVNVKQCFEVSDWIETTKDLYKLILFSKRNASAI